MIYDCPEAVSAILNFIKQKRNEKLLYPSTRPVREDIFEIIGKAGIVLYFPLDDSAIKGCHIEKVVNGKVEQFVFINTTKYVQEQTWTAAHELGHVWRVEEYVNSFVGTKLNTEDIVNRFAAEVLFPQKEFRKVVSDYRKSIGATSRKLTKNQFVQIVTYIMNYYCAPYKAVIRRFVELGMIEKVNELPYIKRFEENEGYYLQLLEQNYYPRLNKSSKACNMEHIKDDITEISRRGLVSKNDVEYYKKLFNLKDENDVEETFVIGGLKEKKNAKGSD